MTWPFCWVAIAVAWGCFFHTIWFVRKSKRFRKDMWEHNGWLLEELLQAHEEIARLRTELAKCGHWERGVPE